MQAQVKTRNSKNLKVKALVDSGCTHMGIDEQLVKDKRIQTKKIDFSFEVFNTDGTKNGEVTKVAPLEVEINGHKETLEAAVTDLDGTDMFLGHDWLVKHNPEVNWKNGTIKFTRCPGNCTMTHKDIRVKTVDGGLYFIASVHFYFTFHFFFFSFFYFLFLEQLGLGFNSHAVTSVTN